MKQGEVYYDIETNDLLIFHKMIVGTRNIYLFYDDFYTNYYDDWEFIDISYWEEELENLVYIGEL